jgi:hypothetical protein
MQVSTLRENVREVRASMKALAADLWDPKEDLEAKLLSFRECYPFKSPNASNYRGTRLYFQGGLHPTLN